MHHIKEKRAQMGVTQVQLAALAGMDPATLNRIEMGKANPNLKTIERLADALGVEVADFFPKAQAPLFDPGPTEAERRYLRAWRAFAWTLAGDWAETPPQSSREIKPLLHAVAALVDAGVFENTNADTATQGEVSLFLNALRKLAEISNAVESDEVADELRRSIALVPQDRYVA